MSDKLDPAHVYMLSGVILSVPVGIGGRDLILILRELERRALEDIVQRDADQGMGG